MHIHVYIFFKGKTHSSVTCYRSKMWLSLSNSWTQLSIFSEDFKFSTDCLTECLKVLDACFQTDTQLIFFVHWEILRIFLKRHLIKTWNFWHSFLSQISPLKSFIHPDYFISFSISVFFNFFQTLVIKIRIWAFK